MSFRLIGLYSPVPGCGKSTVAQRLVQNHGFTLISYATPLKMMLKGLFTSLDMEYDYAYYSTSGKERPIPELGGVTFRHMAQTQGTEWGRNQIADDFWLTCFALRLQCLRDLGIDRVVCDDVRFMNEAEQFQSLKAELWEITRASAPEPAGSHPSNRGLTGFNGFTHHLQNDSDSIAELDQFVSILLHANATPVPA